ncbi:hypothetical protein ABK040_013686 [Willaertia magna]
MLVKVNQWNLEYDENDPNREPLENYYHLLKRFVYVIFGSNLKYQVSYRLHLEDEETVSVLVEFKYAEYGFLNIDELKALTRDPEDMTDVFSVVEDYAFVRDYDVTIGELAARQNHIVKIAAYGIIDRIVNKIISARFQDYSTLKNFIERYKNIVF